MRARSDLLRFASCWLMVTALLLATGCVCTDRNPGLRTRAYLYDAYHAWEGRQHAAALEAIKLALASAQKENVPGDILIEVYDDAGLYFYVNGRFDESLRHQAIAVLLSRKIEVAERLRNFYESNLGTALAGARPGFGNDEHAKDTEKLLAIPGVRENPHIRQYYQPGRNGPPPVLQTSGTRPPMG